MLIFTQFDHYLAIIIESGYNCITQFDKVELYFEYSINAGILERALKMCAFTEIYAVYLPEDSEIGRLHRDIHGLSSYNVFTKIIAIGSTKIYNHLKTKKEAS
ncbi:hypothetical protein ACUXCC_002234 [Cytobacillus horneckiae]